MTLTPEGEARIRLVSYIHQLTPTKTLNQEQVATVSGMVDEVEAAAATAERDLLKHSITMTPSNDHYIEAAATAAERERIAAALPDAVRMALEASWQRDGPIYGPDLREGHYDTDLAEWLLAHPAVRAVFQPEGEPGT